MKINVYFLKFIFASLIVYIEVVLSKDVTDLSRNEALLNTAGDAESLHLIERRSSAYKRLPGWSVYYGKRSGDIALDKSIAGTDNDVSENFLPQDPSISGKLEDKPLTPLFSGLQSFEDTALQGDSNDVLTDFDSWQDSFDPAHNNDGAPVGDELNTNSGEEEQETDDTPNKRFSRLDVDYEKRRQGWYSMYGKRAPQWLATYGKRAPQWLATYGKRSPQWLATYGKRSPQWLATYGKRAPQWLATYGKRAPQWLATYGKRAPQWLATYGKRAPQWLATYGKRAPQWLATYGKRLPGWTVTYGKRSFEQSEDGLKSEDERP